MAFPDIRAGNPLKQRLATGGVAIGSFIRIPAPEVAELCGHAGCDFVLIDMEHSTVTWERAASMVAGAEYAGCVPILRISNGARDTVTRALDIGAHGVMVAQVESGAQAHAIAAATRYGSDGTRGTAGNRRTGYGAALALGEFVEAANAATFLALQIETMRAVEAVEEIVATPGLDCLFVGLSDLSVDLDRPGAWDHPSVLEAAARVQAACHARGVAMGVPVPDPSFAQMFLDRGARLIACGDVGVLGRAMREFVEGVRRFAG